MIIGQVFQGAFSLVDLRVDNDTLPLYWKMTHQTVRRKPDLIKLAGTTDRCRSFLPCGCCCHCHADAIRPSAGGGTEGGASIAKHRGAVSEEPESSTRGQVSGVRTLMFESSFH